MFRSALNNINCFRTSPVTLIFILIFVSNFKKFWIKLKSKEFKIKEKLARKKLKKFHEHDEKLVQKLASSKKLPSKRQLNYISKFLSKPERLIIRILSGIILIAVFSLLFNVYWNNSKIIPAQGGTYTEGLVGSPRYINPLFSRASDVDLDISTLVYSGLFKYTDQGLTKDLLDSYQLSNDQLVYTFNLRQDIKWHDGENLNAEDVIFTFDRIKNTQTKTPLYYNFQGIIIDQIDEFTVRFSLEKPFAPFLESLTTGILPEHIWKNIVPENMMLAEYNLKPIGSGPFEFNSLLKNKNGQIKNFELVANENYYINTPFIEKIDLKFYENFEQAVEALNNKKVDGISYLPKEIRARIINNRNLNFNLLHLPQYTSVFFNYDQNPVLKDLGIRKILTHSVNKEKIVNEILNAEAQIIDACILPNTLGYNPDIVKYPFNVQHARTELEKAGWKLADYEEPKAEGESDETINEEGVSAKEAYAYPVRKKGDRYFEFELTTVNQPENVKIVKELQKEWQQIGAKIDLIIIEPNKIQETIKDRSYQALLYGQILGPDPDPYPFWHSSQRSYPGLNLTSLNHPDVDTLLESARKTSDDKQRAEKYKQFQTIIAETVPAIFLFNPTYTYPQNKKIKGFNTSNIIIPANRFSLINEWYIKTDRKWGK